MTVEDGFDFRGLAGQLNRRVFDPGDVDGGVVERLTKDRHAWLTTVSSSGQPVPMPVWFHFDGARLVVYCQPHAHRITHIFENPDVALHLDSDGLGGGIVIVGGRAAVTAEGVDPREDNAFWVKYHVEAQAVGLTEAIASFSARITITPTTIWTTLPA